MQSRIFIITGDEGFSKDCHFVDVDTKGAQGLQGTYPLNPKP